MADRHSGSSQQLSLLRSPERLQQGDQTRGRGETGNRHRVCGFLGLRSPRNRRQVSAAPPFRAVHLQRKHHLFRRSVSQTARLGTGNPQKAQGTAETKTKGPPRVVAGSHPGRSPVKQKALRPHPASEPTPLQDPNPWHLRRPSSRPALYRSQVVKIDPALCGPDRFSGKLFRSRFGLAFLPFILPVLRLEGQHEGVGKSSPQHDRSKQEHHPRGTVHEDTSSLCGEGSVAHLRCWIKAPAMMTTASSPHPKTLTDHWG